MDSLCTGLCAKGHYCPTGSVSSTQHPCPIGKIRACNQRSPLIGAWIELFLSTMTCSTGRYGSEEGLGSPSCSGPCVHPLDCPIG